MMARHGSLSQNYKPNSLSWALNRLFRKTCIVLVGGYWKTGKTDFALYIAKRCLHMGLVYEVATNIETNGEFKYITDIETLKYWLSSNGHLKLFILDEGNEHLPNTSFMSHKSVGIKEIIPQISKKHGRLIVVAQDLDSIDKTFRSKSWWRGTFKKTDRKTASLTAYWNLHKPLVITEIPKTSVNFDPYLSAPFTEKSDKIVFFKDSERQTLWEWCNGKSIKDLGIHPQALNRLVRPFVKRMLETDRSEKSLEQTN